MRRISLLTLAAFGILMSATTLYGAGVGDRCKVPTSDPTYICPLGSPCLQSIGNKYCSNAGRVCGWKDTAGYGLGQKKDYDGKEYVCTPTGFLLDLGEECELGTSDETLTCATGSVCLKAISKFYCSSAGRICGWSDTSGFAIGQTRTWQGSQYECTVDGFQQVDAPSSTVTIPGVTAIPTRPLVRPLSKAEISVASEVYGRSLAYGEVYVTNTTGVSDGRPWTSRVGNRYTLNVGVNAYLDLTAEEGWRNLLIHELGHVWQGQHGIPFTSNSALHQTLSVIETGSADGAYSYDPGGQWSKYNSEQQAQIIEDWYDDGMSTSSELFPYIRDNVRPGRPHARTDLGGSSPRR